MALFGDPPRGLHHLVPLPSLQHVQYIAVSTPGTAPQPLLFLPLPSPWLLTVPPVPRRQQRGLLFPQQEHL